MKKGKLFSKIVYYLFTFSIGILLALFLPYMYMYYGESLSIINSSLKDGNYADAMGLVGGYYDKQYVFQQDFADGGGIVLFSAATLVYGDGSEEAPADETLLHKAYAGFVYGTADSYDINATGANLSKMIVTDNDGTEHYVEILDYDADGNGEKDSCASHMQYGFFYVDLALDTFGSVKEISLIDKNGSVFANLQVNLSFDQAFFSDVDDFLQEYNRDYKSERLPELDREFLAKSSNYAISSTGVAQSSADKKSAIVVVLYFVGIYVLGDFLVGGHYIVKFFRWLLVKVFKVKFKQKPQKGEEAFGHDYYSKVTFVLDVSAVDDFSQSVNIRYNNDKGEEISFLLLKEQNYTATLRVKAGTYVNLWIDIDKTTYATQNLPETLVVEGYQMAMRIKIIKREE